MYKKGLFWCALVISVNVVEPKIRYQQTFFNPDVRNFIEILKAEYSTSEKQALRYWRNLNQTFKLEVMRYRDNRGRILAHYAAEKGFNKIYDILVRYGADVNLPDNEGDTPQQIHDVGE